MQAKAADEQEARVSQMSIFVNIFTEPGKAFSALQGNGNAWIPMLIVIFSAVAVLLLFYKVVDFEWFKEHLMEYIADPSQNARASKIITKNWLITTSTMAAILTIVLVYCVSALYFFFVSKLNSSPIRYGYWFCFVSWASLPSLLLLPIGSVQIFLAPGGKLLPEQLNPFTLNQLVFHTAVAHPWHNFLESISVFTLWTIILMTIGLQTWLGFSRLKSALLSALPYVTAYGAWAVVTGLSKTA